MKEYTRIIRAIENEVWAIEESKLDAICEFVRLKSQGVQIEFKAPKPPEPEFYFQFEDDSWTSVPTNMWYPPDDRWTRLIANPQQRILYHIRKLQELEHQGHFSPYIRSMVTLNTENPEARQPASNGENLKGNGIAVLPIFGVITQRINVMNELSGGGGTSMEVFKKQFRNAMADSEIGSILLEVDSPGGGVFGVQEVADEINRAANSPKRIVAHANSVAASAAYWLASQARELYVTPSGEVGSIGVYAIHEDISKAQDAIGIKTTYVKAGKYKAELASEFPLEDEARAYLQSRVDDYYATFVRAVARGRSVSPGDVRAGFGEGRMVGAKDATTIGMVDGIATLDDVISALQKGEKVKTRAQSEEVQPELSDEDRSRRLQWA